MIRTRLSLFFLLVSGLLLLAPDSLRAQSTAVLEPETATRFEFPLTIQSTINPDQPSYTFCICQVSPDDGVAIKYLSG